MNHCLLALMNLLRDDSGQDLVEYGLVLAVILLGSVTAINGMTAAIATMFTRVDTLITSNA